METIKLNVADETLRDGEQQVGLFFNEETKRILAHLIAETGVDQIALMPAVHDTEEHLVKTLVSRGLRQQIIASTMMTHAFIDQSRACGAEKVTLFYAVSDYLLLLRDPEIATDLSYTGKNFHEEIPPSVIAKVRKNMLEKAIEHFRYAAEQGLTICFAAEDASRADFDFLVECICTFEPYIEQFLLCDTVGILTPEKTFVWIRNLLKCSNYASLAVHFHNDMGLALENTIQAVYAGASGISGTFGGIGERAGNAALEQVLNGLKLRFGWEIEGISYDALSKVTDALDQLGARSNPPYSQQAQWHETGIHVNSMLRDHQSYSIFTEGEPEIWFGKYSGASNFQYLFERYLEKPLAPEHYKRLQLAIKALSVQQKLTFSMEEVLALFTQGKLEF
jgi:isopropylmalate/homocitrate/citramalate synthase